MNKWLEILLGLLMVTVPLILATLVLPSFWNSALIVLQGGIFWAIVGIGLLLILLGLSDLKN